MHAKQKNFWKGFKRLTVIGGGGGGGMLWISGDICAFWYLFIVKHILNIEENCNITNFSKSTTFPYSYTLYIYNKGNPLGDYFCVPPWSLLLAGCRYIMVLIETGLFTPADPAASCHHKSWPALTQRSHHIASSLLHLSSLLFCSLDQYSSQ